MIKILSTKTLDASVVEYVNKQGMILECLDFIQTDAIPFNDNDIDWNTVGALVFTSSNAVRYFYESEVAAKVPAGKLIFSLSGKTAAEFSKYNAAPSYVSTNASSLCDAIIGIRGVKSVVHICGNLKLGVVETRLRATGIQYQPLTIYRTHFIETIPFDTVFEVVMFFSPSGVESYSVKNGFTDEAVYCCIGVTTAEALKEKRSNLKILIPDVPKPEAMVDAITLYYKTRQIASWPN